MTVGVKTQNRETQISNDGVVRGATEELARFAANLTWDDLPHDVQGQARLLVLDALGCALAGSLMPHGQVALAYARERAGGREASLITGERVGVFEAAFANTLCGRANTFDDTHEQGSIHSGVASTMTVLALGEKTGAHGTELLTAVVAGTEIALRVAVAVSPSHYEQGFHSTGTCNVFGTAAAAGLLLRLGEDALQAALGIAGDQASGLRQYQISGTIATSAFHAASAAQSGIMAALLAEKGFPAPRDMLEGEFGFCNMLAHTHDAAALTADLGREYRLLEVGIKPYPSCRYVHGAVGAMERLVNQFDLGPANVEEVTVKTFSFAKDLCQRPLPETIIGAQLSMEYNVARMLCNREVTISDFTEERISEPAVASMQRRIGIETDDELTALYPERWPYQVELLTRDGRLLRERVDFPPGSRGNPLTTDQVRNKFRALATMVLPESRAIELEDAVLNLDHRSVSDLVACLSE